VPETLIIGYGNPLRGDDAAGCRAARELEHLFHDDPEVEVIASHQLTPEMAEDVARSRFVIFIDAALGDRPGAIRQIRVSPEPGPAGFTHHLRPSSLLSAAEQLYGDAPVAMAITLAGWSFELGDELSPGAARCLPELIRLARGMVRNHHQAAQAKTLAHAT
jgi:hydrogenase maturation protease